MNVCKFVEKRIMILPMGFVYYNHINIIENLFDNLTENIDIMFDDLSDFDDEYSISDTNMMLIETSIEELLIPYTADMRSDKRLEGKKIKNQRVKTLQIGNDHTLRNCSALSTHDTLENYLPISRSGTEEKDTLEEAIVTDKNVKVILQLPTNNRKENIKAIIHNDNSVRISYLNPKGKPSHYSVQIPYRIITDTARSTYRNGILEIVLDRK